jgi:hypothetical protein
MTQMGTFLRACGKGNKVACTIAKRIQAIYAGSVISFSDANVKKKHPNKMPFRATLLICDEPSDKPPHGSQGHRILVTSEVAKSKLDGLPGMAVNYDPSDMDEHETRHKVGVITKSWMEGPEVKIAGYVWKKDFPEAERDLKRKDLGTSMELADVYVKNEHANIWELNDFEFTGATILRRDAAAYTKTSLAAAAKAAVLGEEGETIMAKHKEEKKRKVTAAAGTRNGSGDLALMSQAISGSITSGLKDVFGSFVSDLKASNQAVLDEVTDLKGLYLIQAAAQPGPNDESDDEVVLHAAKEDASDDSDDMAAGKEDDSDDMAAKSEDDSDDMAAQGADESASDASSDSSDASSDLEAMEDLELEHPDMSTGEVNKDATNRGSKQSVTKPPKQGEHFKGNVAKGRLHSAAKGAKMKKPFPGLEAAAEQLRTVHASNRKLKRTIHAMGNKYGKKLKKLQASYQAQEERLEYFTDREARRSAMPTELINLAAKSGVNLGEVKAAGQQMTVTQVDHMFATAKMSGINIDPEQRIAMKMQLEQEGLMENGEITRNYGRAN